MLDPALRDLAMKYGVNPDKPFFPVNSLRIVYFLISDHYTQNNEAVRDKIGSLIPKIEALISFRAQFRQQQPNESREKEWQALQTPLQEIYNVIRTPQLEQTFAQYFWYLLPLQDDILLNLYDQPSLSLLLKVRAMDSFVYAALIHALITQNFPAQDFYQPLLHQLNLIYQINDLVDAVIFAKDDLAANYFSPFRVIQQLTDDPNSAKELIRGATMNFLKESQLTTFPPTLQQQINQFTTGLSQIVLG